MNIYIFYIFVNYLPAFLWIIKSADYSVRVRKKSLLFHELFVLWSSLRQQLSNAYGRYSKGWANVSNNHAFLEELMNDSCTFFKAINLSAFLFSLITFKQL